LIYLRHKNGNGKYYGYDAFIDKDSLLNRNSNLFDNADVWTSQVINSTVAYKSKIRNSVLFHSKVGDADYESEVVDSRLKHTFVKGGTVLGAILDTCYISEECVVKGGNLQNCHLTGAVVIENKPILKNLKLHSRMRIGYGNWEREPRYFEVGDGDLIVGITESTEGYVYIGCQRKRIADWLKKKELFSRIAGWSEEMTASTVERLGEWLYG